MYPGWSWPGEDPMVATSGTPLRQDSPDSAIGMKMDLQSPHGIPPPPFSEGACH